MVQTSLFFESVGEIYERVFQLLTELVKREQKALLLATHNPQIARASDVVHEMKDGVIRNGGAVQWKPAASGPQL